MSARQIAMTRGRPHYSGLVCAKHLELCGKRYTANGRCVACAREQDRARKDRIRDAAKS